MKAVLKAYGFNEAEVQLTSFGSGLINHTWKLVYNNEEFILQKINQLIFKNPKSIEQNIDLIANYLRQNNKEYYFVAPLKNKAGASMTQIEGGDFYRMFPFVKNSVTIDVVETPDQAYEAARQFGRFTKNLRLLDMHELKTTIPAFHDLGLRYQQFLLELENGNMQRIIETEALIHQLKDWAFIKEEYDQIKTNEAFKLRVTHHDTKISNVLFDKKNKGICVIDLDTIMPGYFISDVGDMMRTYLSPVSEEETDFSKIEIREAFYESVVKGYYNEMKNELSDTEKKYFFYAGTFMIYMQALRFITDYLNDDCYYVTKYPDHNLQRAKNQMILLEKMFEKEERLKGIKL